MRITCPNCSAQYEIDAALLPDEGREVQCSACGHVWFQDGPNAHRARTYGAARAEDTPAAQPQQPTDTAQPSDYAAPDDAQIAPGDTPPARPVDEKVLGILREEAEFEAKARAREAGHIETQPELGLQGSAPWPRQSHGPEPEPESATQQATGSKSDGTFPDIEDISSTLEPIGTNRKTDDASVNLPATAQQRSRSFISGLIIPLALALILIALYLGAPALVASLPALEPALTSYVQTIDGLRVSLNALLGR